MLRLYGSLSIDGSDGVGLGQRSTRGLIAYLALKRGPASSDELLEALWPGQPPGTSRSRLWKARRLAQGLLGDALQRGKDGYQLDRRALPSDSDEIERLQQGHSDPDRLERALSLIGGEPLIDIDYPWADNERRRLQALRAGTLAKAAAARLESGNQNGALTAAEQLIELDPLNEQGWRLAMHAEAALGQRQAILDRYQELSRELDDRLGLRPASETRDTYHRLLSQE
jgi:DNA-binding SARP family transcriptional activator